MMRYRRAICAVAAPLLVITTLSTVGAGAAGASITAGQAVGSPEVYTAASCAQPYIVPAGVTSVRVTAVGEAGGAGQNLSGFQGAVVHGGSGGLGSKVTTVIQVTPGEELYVGVGSTDGMNGGNGGYGGNYEKPTDTYALGFPTNPAAGGDGGAASYVAAQAPGSSGGSPSHSGCFPSDPLVVAAGGGGGGGAGYWKTCVGCTSTGGNGGTEGGAAATAGTSASRPSNEIGDPQNAGTQDGGGAATAGTSPSSGYATGGGGLAGVGAAITEVGTFDIDSYVGCTSGYIGDAPGQHYYGDGGLSYTGSPYDGGDGGAAGVDTSPLGPCPPTYITTTVGSVLVGGYSNSNSGGGGGGGGGYVAGAGGGGGTDNYSSGGGGAAGKSYVAGQTVHPTATTTTASVTIQPVAVAPAFIGGTSFTCTVGSECTFRVTATGDPEPTIGSTGSIQGLTPSEGTNDEGQATLDWFGNVTTTNLGTYHLHLVANNTVSPQATETITVTLTWGTLDSLSLSTLPDAYGIVAGSGTETQLSARGTYASGELRSMTDLVTWTSSNPSVATISSSGQFDPLGAGTTKITATYGSVSTSKTVTVTRGLAQSLTLTPSGHVTIGLGQTRQLTATAHYLAGTTANVTPTVTWATTPPSGVVAVSSSGVITAVGTANSRQAEVRGTLKFATGSWVTAAITVSVSVASPTSITVTPSDPSVAAGSQVQLTATGTYPGGYTYNLTTTVTWTSGNPADLANELYGNFSAAATGGGATVKVTAKYGGVSGSTTVTTLPGTPTSLTLTPPLYLQYTTTPSLGLGQTRQLTATAHYADGKTANFTNQVTWKSLNPTLFSVTSSGVVTATGGRQGTLGSITATYGGLSTHTNLLISLDTPTSVTVTPSSVTLPRGGDQVYTATGTFPGGLTANITTQVRWSTGNSAVATVSTPAVSGETVHASATAGGQSTTITATAPNGKSGSGTLGVEVGDPTSLTITVPSTTLDLGTTEQLTATAHYQNGTTATVTDSVAWASGTSATVSVSPTGVATAGSGTGAGSFSAYISATLTNPDKTTLYGQSPFIKVTRKHPTSLTLSVTTGFTPSSTVSTVSPTGLVKFIATGHFPDGYTLNVTTTAAWSSSSALLKLTGGSTFRSHVTGTGGSATVTATLNGVSASAPVTLSGVIAIDGTRTFDKAHGLTTSASPDYVSPTFTATGGSGTYDWTLYVTGPNETDFHLSSTTGTTVTIVGAAKKTNSPVHFTLQLTDPHGYTGWLWYAVTLTVTAQSQTITATALPASPVAGQSVPLATLHATSASGGPITITTVGTTVCAVKGTTLDFLKGGTCTVTFNQAGNSYYAKAPQVEEQVQVLYQSSPTFATSPTGITIASSPYDAHATGNGGVITIEVDATTTTNDACSLAAPTVSKAGTGSSYVDFDHPGTCAIEAVQAATTGYAAGVTEQRITVGQASQTITFTSSVPTGPTVGGSYTPAAQPGASGTAVTLSIGAGTTDQACSLTGGVVHFDHAGTCVVQATEPASADYLAAQASQSFTIGRGSQSVDVVAPTTLNVGQTYHVSPMAVPSDLLATVTVVTPTTDGACTYTAPTGELSAVAPGNCVLDVSQPGDADYTAAPTVEVTIAVTNVQLSITSSAFTTSADDQATNPFTIALTNGRGGSATLPTALTVTLTSSAPTAEFATSPGGTSVSTVTIPAGTSSVVAYFGSPVAMYQQIQVQSTDFGTASQFETVQPAGVAQLRFITPPADQLVGEPATPVVVQAVDPYGNPVTGVSVTLTTTAGVVGGGTATTGLAGLATFSDLAFETAGSYVLTASAAGSAPVRSGRFQVFPVVTATKVAPTSGLVSGGQVVTVTGSGFTSGATEAWFGTAVGTTLKVLSNTSLTVVAPAATVGLVTVQVGNDVERSAVTTGDHFTYTDEVTSTTTLGVSTTTSTLGAAVQLTATVVGSSTTYGQPTGTVAFFDGTDQIGSAPLKTTGRAKLSTATLPAGSGTLTAVYGGSRYYLGSTSAAVAHLVRVATSVQLDLPPGPFFAGSPVTLTVGISGGGGAYGEPTGTVTLSAGGTVIGTATVTDAGARLTTTLPAGTLSLTATYSGDTAFAPATSPAVAETVYGGTVPVTLTAPATSTYGATYTMKAKVVPSGAGDVAPTGSVSFYVGGSWLCTSTLTREAASCSTTALPPGTDDVYATYGGNAIYFTGNSSTTTVKVTAPTTVSIRASRVTPTPTDEVTFTTKVSTTGVPVVAPPGGLITLMDGSTALFTTVLVNGSASVTIPATALGLGQNDLTFAYAGTGPFAAAVSSPTVVTVRVPSQLHMSPTDTPWITGRQAMVTVYFSGRPAYLGSTALNRTGTISIYTGSRLLASAAVPPDNEDVTFDLPTLSPGAYPLRAVYSGDAYYLPEHSTAVEGYFMTNPTVTVSSSVNPASHGKRVTFTATVVPPAPAGASGGTATFYDGTTVLGSEVVGGDGQATYSTSALVPGNHSIRVSYGGNEIDASGWSAPLTETILGGSQVTMTSSDPRDIPDTTEPTIVLTATVSGSVGLAAPTGTVTFEEGSIVLGTAPVGTGGVASATIASNQLRGGAGTLVAVYSGDSTLAGSKSPGVPQYAMAPSTVAVTTSANPVLAGSPVTITASVGSTRAFSQPPAGTVTFRDGSVVLATEPLGGTGSTSFTTSTLPAGTNGITATYGGDSIYEGSVSPRYDERVLQSTGTDAATVTVASSANPGISGDPPTITVTVAATTSGAGTPTGKVVVTANGAALGSFTLNGQGVASFPLTTGRGVQIISAGYAGNKTFQPAVGSYRQVVVDPTATGVWATPNPVLIGTSTTLWAYVTDMLAPGVLAGTVTFEVGSTVVGTASLDSTGTASLTFATTGYPAGTLLITATYGGSTTFGSSTGTTVLTVQNALVTPTLRVTVSADPVTPGTTVTVTATLSGAAGTPTGDVSFTFGTAPPVTVPLDATGVATYTTTPLSVGGPLIVGYGGDADYRGTTQFLYEVVGYLDTVAITSSPNPASSGVPVTVTVTVAGTPDVIGVPTGSVYLLQQVTGGTGGGYFLVIDTATLVNGQAVFTLTSLPVGTDTFLAAYTPTDSYVPGQSPTLTETVTPSTS